MKYIDLKSDKVTKPTQKMGEAMKKDMVEDELLRNNPALNELEEYNSKLFGMGSKIHNLEYYLPTKVVTNDDLAIELEGFKIDKALRIGIKQRHIAAEDQTSVDLAYEAGKKILAKFDKDKIDYLIFVTETGDYRLPNSANILHDRLGLRSNAGAIDIVQGCTGVPYALNFAKGLIATRTAKNVLILFADAYSKIINSKDKVLRTIFGDAGSGLIVSKSEKEHIHEFVFGTDGSGKDNLIIRNGGLRHIYDGNAEEIVYGSGNVYTHNDLYMNGPGVFNFTNSIVPDLVDDILNKNKVVREDIDMFIFHQANKSMLEDLRIKSNIPEEKFYCDISDIGNTVSSSIIIALKRCMENGLIHTNDKVLLAGFGVGLSWAGTIIEF